MSELPSSTPQSKKPLQKPVFIIQPFDPSNVENMKGNVTITLNKRFATDLCRLIRECELSSDEGYIFAMQGNIQRWYKDRYDEIKRQKSGITTEEAIKVLQSQVSEEMNTSQVVVTEIPPPNLRKLGE